MIKTFRSILSQSIDISSQICNFKHSTRCIPVRNMANSAHRKFYDFDESDKSESKTDASPVAQSTKENLFAYLNENILGSGTIFSSPFGPRKITYCDYVASGRSVSFIENYINGEVLPTYGSTHTTTSVTSLQTSLFRVEARNIIRNAVRASEHDRIIFTGSGTTGALHKLIYCLQLKAPPIVFVDCYAHHSSLLPWREIAAKVVRIKETADGSLDLHHLQQQLTKFKDEPGLKIGCFSAASNITGIINSIDEVTILLHHHNALAFWDYATAAPYIDITMNPLVGTGGLAHKDAIFFSLHKFIGGVQTPGVLIAKKDLFKNEVPYGGGGGTVFFVSRESHRYLKDVEEREEGGTPPIVETIRGGMVMQLKMNLTPNKIMERCQYLSRKLEDFAKTVPELVPLGNLSHPSQLPILSFLIRHSETGRFLHHNFVAVILNDIYGIQSRGGCACAGPYAEDLMGIDESRADEYLEALLERPDLDRSHLRRREEHSNLEVLRPGFTRIILPYSSTDEQIDYILSAIREVCTHGWKLLPQYHMDNDTGNWKHHTNLVFKNRQWLENISYSQGFFEANLKKSPEVAPSYEECLKEAQNIFQAATKAAQRRVCPDESVIFHGNASHLRWFLLPYEAKMCLTSTYQGPETKMPFTPIQYPIPDEIMTQRKEYVWSNMDAASKYPSQNSAVTPEGNKKEVKPEMNGQVDDKESPVENGLTCAIRTKNVPVINTVKAKWKSPPKKLFTDTVTAIKQFQMINDGDKVLVCLSGGKDSLSLLHVMKQYEYFARSNGVNITLGAITVDPMSSSYDPRPLIPYLAELDVPYFFEEQKILKQALEMENLGSICSFCSRMKRGRLYTAARREGYNVLAFGQHLDDLAESFLMSVFHNGRLRTMKASYTVKQNDLRVIRPFAFVREKALREFAESRKLPVIPENCPACFEEPKERHNMKQLLAQEELSFPTLFGSIRTAIMPLLAINKTGVEDKLFGKPTVEGPKLPTSQDLSSDEE